MADVRVRINTDAWELADKFEAAHDLVETHAREGTDQVAQKGKELARGFAPSRTGELEAYIDSRWWGGLNARVYVRKGGPLNHDNRPGGPTGRGRHYGHGYGYWQEVGAYGGKVFHPFMEPAAAALEGGLAGDIMDGFVWRALVEAGLDASFGMLGPPPGSIAENLASKGLVDSSGRIARHWKDINIYRYP